MAINKKYSYGSFKRKTFKEIDPRDFDGEIINACFSQDQPYTDVFPAGITTVFMRCNLDNCNIPAGATVNGGTNKHFIEQNDGEYWLVDTDLRPIEPRNKATFIKYGLSINPANIPAIKLKFPLTHTNHPKINVSQKIQGLMADHARLKAILIEKGELPVNGGGK